MHIHNHLEPGPRVRRNNVPMWCYLCIVSFRMDPEFISYVEKFLPHREWAPYSLQRTTYVLVLLLREETSIRCENHMEHQNATCGGILRFVDRASCYDSW